MILAMPGRCCCGSAAAADLRLTCVNSVSIVGSRAATGYGNHVAIEMAAALAERGVAVVSGGAFGIDASAHRGALAADGVTVAVLAGGLQFGYPKGHGELFAAIAARRDPRQRVSARQRTDEARLPGPQPDHRGAKPRHRRGRGGAAQWRAQLRPARPRAVPAGDGGARPGHLRAVGRMPRADQGLRRHVRHLRQRRSRAHRAAGRWTVARAAARTGAATGTPSIRRPWPCWRRCRSAAAAVRPASPSGPGSTWTRRFGASASWLLTASSNGVSWAGEPSSSA